MSDAPKEYEHIEFSFSKPSGRRNGKHYECTAFLLIPAELAAEVKAWTGAEGTDGRINGADMLRSLRDKGALLHRQDGPAYKEVEKSLFRPDEGVTTVEQYWEKGVQKSAGSPRVRPLGKFSF